MKLSNWGNYPLIDTKFISVRTEAEVKASINCTEYRIARGLGRCYGDSALNEVAVVSTQRFSHVLDFDPQSGVLVAEAGVSLASLVDDFASRGFFPSVTPGTKFVTLGGAIAADVHGKNHHVAGSFCTYVQWIDLLVADGRVIRCSRDIEPDLFHATCGGMGLTGIILRCAITLSPLSSMWIRQESVKAANLEEIMDCFENSADWTYSVAWIDCLQRGDALGRSIMLRGEHAIPHELPSGKRRVPFFVKPKLSVSVPVSFPGWVLNTGSVKAFNALYYVMAPRDTSASIISLDNFFYPLDAVLHWNRIYGRRGFTQYQCVLPIEAAKEGLRMVLDTIAQSGQGSFLAVLKLFGKQARSRGNISFPDEGYTLALDFPMSRALFPLLDRLDDIVHDCGGHLYLTKDVRMSAAAFKKGYGHLLEDFLSVKTRWDPENRFRSLQSIRLMGE